MSSNDAHAMAAIQSVSKPPLRIVNTLTNASSQIRKVAQGLTIEGDFLHLERGNIDGDDEPERHILAETVCDHRPFERLPASYDERVEPNGDDLRNLRFLIHLWTLLTYINLQAPIA